MPSEPGLQTQGGVYLFSWRDEAIQIRVDRLHTEKAGVYGELLIRSFAPGILPHLHGPVHFNFISTQARSSLVKHLGELYPLPWSGILEQLCYNVVEAHRTGAEVVKVADYVVPERSGFRIEPILENNQATLMFGEGDSLKSYFASYLSVLICTGISDVGLTPEPGRVLYLDYETDADTFWERTNMITAGLMVSIPEGLYYRPMVESLSDEFTRINTIVMREKIDVVVVDSAAPAVLLPNDAEVVTAYFRTLRALQVTSLTVAHITKEGPVGDYPFGSAFWKNLPRSLYAIKADRNEDDVAISLRHTKANNGRRLPPLGYSFKFSDDELLVTQAAPGDYEDLAKDLPIRRRIFAALTSPKTIKDIAEELDVRPDTVARTLNRDQIRPGSKRVFAKSLTGEYWSKMHREDEGDG